MIGAQPSRRAILAGITAAQRVAVFEGTLFSHDAGVYAEAEGRA